MRNRGMFIAGAVLIGLGVLFFIGAVFHIDIWAICCPVSLIGVGVWIILRPGIFQNGGSKVTLIGQQRLNGDWQVQDAEYWFGVGELNLDLLHAQIPYGETVIRVNGFVNEIRITLPAEMGLAVQASGFVVENEIMGDKVSNIMMPVDYVSPNYTEADRKLRLEANGFVVNLNVNQG